MHKCDVSSSIQCDLLHKGTKFAERTVEKFFSEKVILTVSVTIRNGSNVRQIDNKRGD